MSETNNGIEVLAATGGQAMMAPGGGLSGGKLALADAETGDVLAGKTYYAGDKELKTGTLALADATATAADVASGKTFYAGDKTIKTGNARIGSLQTAGSTGGSPSLHTNARYRINGVATACVRDNLKSRIGSVYVGNTRMTLASEITPRQADPYGIVTLQFFIPSGELIVERNTNIVAYVESGAQWSAAAMTVIGQQV